MTSADRTVLDVCRAGGVLPSLVMADAAIHDPRKAGAPLTTLTKMRNELELLSPFRGSKQCAAMLALAKPGAGSPGETVSRFRMHVFGFPSPVLQQPFSDARGLIGYTDFWWPEYGIIGEFDGKGKYLRDDLLRGGETPGEAVYREKVREDRLRALGHRVVRWDWTEAWAGERLRAKLLAGGLPQSGRGAAPDPLSA